jgi:hypothetical protein
MRVSDPHQISFNTSFQDPLFGPLSLQYHKLVPNYITRGRSLNSKILRWSLITQRPYQISLKSAQRFSTWSMWTDRHLSLCLILCTSCKDHTRLRYTHYAFFNTVRLPPVADTTHSQCRKQFVSDWQGLSDTEYHKLSETLCHLHISSFSMCDL